MSGGCRVGDVIEAPEGSADATIFAVDPTKGLWGRTFYDSNAEVMRASLVADEHYGTVMPGQSFVMEVPGDAEPPRDESIGFMRGWHQDGGVLSAVILEVSPQAVLLRCVENSYSWPDLPPTPPESVPDHDPERQTIVVAGVDVPASPAFALSIVRSKVSWAQEALFWLVEQAGQDKAIREAVVRNNAWLLGFRGLTSDIQASSAVAACKTLHITRANLWDETLPLRDRVNSGIHVTRLLRPFFESRMIEGIGQA